MTLPRLSISGLMAVVLILAVDFAVVRAAFVSASTSLPWAELLVIAILPMGNILAIGLAVLLATRRRPRASRPALIGFEAAGLAAWLGLVAGSVFATRPTHDSIRGMLDVSGLNPGIGLATLAGLIFLAPQLGLAALGRLVGRRYAARRGSCAGEGAAGRISGPDADPES